MTVTQLKPRRLEPPRTRWSPAAPAQPGLDTLVGELRLRLDPLLTSLLDHLRSRHPDLPDLVSEQLLSLIRTSLDAELRSLPRLGPPDLAPETEALAADPPATRQDLELLLSRYRLTERVLFEAWLELVDHSVSLGEERRRVLLQGSDCFSDYAEQLSAIATAAYLQKMERRVPGGEGRRLQAIRSILAGKPDGGIAFDLDQHHLAVLAWGDQANEAISSLAGFLERPFLLVGPCEDAWWGWISGTRPCEDREEQVLRRFQPPPGSQLAVGQTGFGVAGFRSSHRQALQARRLVLDPAPAVIHYADLAVEALALENPDEASAFVAHELRGIEDESAQSVCLRETLAAYFAAGHNAASAAATLGVHQQTVANRLRAIEERLGQRSIGVRRVELELALRLRSSLVAEPAR